jgi:hypothetical protein
MLLKQALALGLNWLLKSRKSDPSSMKQQPSGLPWSLGRLLQQCLHFLPVSKF